MKKVSLSSIETWHNYRPRETKGISPGAESNFFQIDRESGRSRWPRPGVRARAHDRHSCGKRLCNKRARESLTNRQCYVWDCIAYLDDVIIYAAASRTAADLPNSFSRETFVILRCYLSLWRLRGEVTASRSRYLREHSNGELRSRFRANAFETFTDKLISRECARFNVSILQNNCTHLDIVITPRQYLTGSN